MDRAHRGLGEPGRDLMVVLSALLAGLAAAVLIGGPPRRPRVQGAATRSRPRPGPERRWLPAVTGLAAGVAVVAVLPGVPGAVAGVVVGGWVARRAARAEPAAERRRRSLMAAELPLVVDLLATTLRAGAPPAAALDQIARAVDPPMRTELRSWCTRLSLGADPLEVWAAMARQPELGPLGRTLLRAAQSGSSVSEALGRLTEDLRGRHRTEMESRARAVGVRATIPLGLCLLPAFVLVGIVPLIAGAILSTPLW